MRSRPGSWTKRPEAATPTQALTQLGSFAGLVATAGPGLIILLSVLAIIGMVVQLAMVLIRSVLLVVWSACGHWRLRLR